MKNFQAPPPSPSELARLGHYEQAIAELEKIPIKSVSEWLLLGECLLELKAIPNARQAFESALRMSRAELELAETKPKDETTLSAIRTSKLEEAAAVVGVARVIAETQPNTAVSFVGVNMKMEAESGIYAWVAYIEMLNNLGRYWIAFRTAERAEACFPENDLEAQVKIRVARMSVYAKTDINVSFWLSDIEYVIRNGRRPPIYPFLNTLLNHPNAVLRFLENENADERQTNLALDSVRTAISAIHTLSKRFPHAVQDLGVAFGLKFEKELIKRMKELNHCPVSERSILDLAGGGDDVSDIHINSIIPGHRAVIERLLAKRNRPKMSIEECRQLSAEIERKLRNQKSSADIMDVCSLIERVAFEADIRSSQCHPQDFVMFCNLSRFVSRTVVSNKPDLPLAGIALAKTACVLLEYIGGLTDSALREPFFFSAANKYNYWSRNPDSSVRILADSIYEFSTAMELYEKYEPHSWINRAIQQVFSSLFA